MSMTNLYGQVDEHQGYNYTGKDGCTVHDNHKGTDHDKHTV